MLATLCALSVAADPLHVRYVALSLQWAREVKVLKAAVDVSRRVVPELELCDAVDGFNRSATIHAMRSRGLTFHKLTHASHGMLANWLTKYSGLEQQVQRGAPFQVMFEDDLQLRDGFREFIEAQVRKHLLGENLRRPVAEQVDLVVLGRWGEGYITSLASARRVLARLHASGIRRNPDIQLNDGSCGRTIQLPAPLTPWTPGRKANKGDIRKTPQIDFESREIVRQAYPCSDYMAGPVCHELVQSGGCLANHKGNWSGASGLFCRASCGSCDARGRMPCTVPRASAAGRAAAAREEAMRGGPSKLPCIRASQAAVASAETPPAKLQTRCSFRRGNGAACDAPSGWCDSFLCCDMSLCAPKLGGGNGVGGAIK